MVQMNCNVMVQMLCKAKRIFGILHMKHKLFSQKHQFYSPSQLKPSVEMEAYECMYLKKFTFYNICIPSVCVWVCLCLHTQNNLQMHFQDYHLSLINHCPPALIPIRVLSLIVFHIVGLLLIAAVQWFSF